MVFAEKKTNEGFHYFTEDVFGKLDIYTDQKVDGDLLDQIVGLALDSGGSAKRSEVQVEHPDIKINYVLERSSQWQENGKHDTDEAWSDTPIKTKRLERLYALVPNWMIQTLNWCKRFVAAFKEALRKANK